MEKQRLNMVPNKTIKGLDERLFNSLVEIFKFQLSFAFFPKEMHQQCRLCLVVHMLAEGTEDGYVITSQRQTSLWWKQHRCSKGNMANDWKAQFQLFCLIQQTVTPGKH